MRKTSKSSISKFASTAFTLCTMAASAAIGVAWGVFLGKQTAKLEAAAQYVVLDYNLGLISHALTQPGKLLSQAARKQKILDGFASGRLKEETLDAYGYNDLMFGKTTVRMTLVSAQVVKSHNYYLEPGVTHCVVVKVKNNWFSAGLAPVACGAPTLPPVVSYLPAGSPYKQAYVLTS